MQDNKKLIKLLTETIKKEVSERGINPTTKNGNQELALLLKSLPLKSFESQEQVKNYGKKLGAIIVEISQTKGKNYLDRGVIREISLQNKLPAFSDRATTKSQPTVTTVSNKVSPPKEEIKSEKILDKKSEPLAKDKATETTTEQNSTSMSLKDRLTEDIKIAMKAKDKIRLETVRGIKKAVIEKEVSVRPNGQEILTQDQEIELLAQQAKQRRESIEQYKKAERDDLADKEAQELAIIETYLPKQLSDQELETVLDQIIASTGASSSKDIGKVMGTAMKQLKGKADGKKIQSLVKNKLEQ